MFITSLFQLESKKLQKSLTIWALAATAQFLLSTIFYRLLLDYMQLTQSNFFEQTETLPDITLTVIQPYFSWSVLIFVFIAPLITLHTLSFEKRENTFYLLASTPITATQYILGKFFTYSLYLLGFLLLVLLPPLTLMLTTSVDWGVFASSLIAIGLLDLCFIALGMFFACLFSTPYLAAGITFISAFALLIIDWLNPFPKALESLTLHFSLLRHAYGLFQGQLALQDIGFYCIFIALFLFWSMRVTHHKLSSQK